MLSTIITKSLEHWRVVLVITGCLAVAGVIALWRTPLDALPDLSETQVILYSEYPGQAPQLVEDQVSYPLVRAMLSVPKARVVRGFSFFGVSYVYVIFAEGTDIYTARSRVIEALAQVGSQLPRQVTPRLGPDASGTGWVYQFALQSASLNLAQQRSLEDNFIQGQLSKALGVAEVATIGGVVQTYQVVVDPLRLKALDLDLRQITTALQQNNLDVGARAIELSETEYMLRGRGYLHSVADIGHIVLENRKGLVIHISDVARVEMVPDERRGIGEFNGTGEAVSGIVMARAGENILAVVDNLKHTIGELTAGLPPDVKLVPVYDRSDLIHRAIVSLRSSLVEECLIVALVCALFLLHLRSALVAVVTLPLAILMAFIAMHALGVGANIMSLGGIAIAIGATVDAAIVMIENVHKHLERAKPEDRHADLVINACREVGPALFFSLCIITLSFLPVLALTDQEGKLFTPLALTKSFSMAAAAILSITLIPVLMLLFVKGRVRPERDNPLNRVLIRLYQPCLEVVLAWKKTSIAFAFLLLVATYWPFSQLGREFMPELNEGTLLYMPSAQPGLSVTDMARLLQQQDKIIKSFPEVASVYGKAGHANTATDPAPLEMVETLIQLKPESEWRTGVTMSSLIKELDQALTLPGITNAWTMPIKARIAMLSTGIRTPLGLKLFGSNLAELERLTHRAESIIKTVPGSSSVYAERLSGSFYLNLTIDPERLALYGVNREVVLDTFATAVGGEVATTLIDGRARIPVSVRYERDWRSDPATIEREVLVKTPSGAYIPLGQLGHLSIESGSPGIRTENGLLSAYIFVDVRDEDIGHFVQDAQKKLQAELNLPTGYYTVWSGEFEHMERAYQRLAILIPVTLVLIFGLLWLNFRRLSETLIVLLSVPFALIGGVWLVWWLDYHLSVAVIIGFIALAGVAAETGVVMLLYLDQAWQKAQTNQSSSQDAIIEGAVGRIRPKMMTVAAIIGGLLPILWGTGTGHEVMQRIAAPMVGGMLSSCLLTLLVIPALYAWVKESAKKNGRN